MTNNPTQSHDGPDFLTTREVAAYLRIKERRVYELVRQRAIPCTRVTGKWLFPRALIDLWLVENAEGEIASPAHPPPVIAGSHDPLLDWAAKESGCGLALLPGGSLDGIRRFAAGEAVIAGLHLLDPESGTYNVPALGAGLAHRAAAGRGVVLLEWARRRQGLVVAAGNPHGVAGLHDLAAKGLRVVRRQREAGSHLLLAHLLERAGLTFAALNVVDETAHGETDLGLAILEGRADAGLAVEAVARSLKLDFVPLAEERYDLLLRRRDYFEPPVQTLFAFARTDAFRARADQMGGYDIRALGTVHYNGP
ncbi:MAG: helix-turn-helix domain-containing protein [Alphaproteobacteria bacterium]|nr:MAG: helix-turn-helix domain-containing protein [Alphaproteobacteria bacterium]